MLSSYFKLTIRNIKKQKLFSFINISGLALGMACCILIMLYVRYETSFDNYHDDVDKIYRVTDNCLMAGKYRHYAIMPGAAAPAAYRAQRCSPRQAQGAFEMGFDRIVFTHPPERSTPVPKGCGLALPVLR